MISDKAFSQEVRQLTDTAFRVAYLILGNTADCEDAMSEAILRAYENRGKLKKRESFRAWFLQILRNEAYTLLRRGRRVSPVEKLPEAPGHEQDEAGRIDLRSAVEQLPRNQRTALLLQQEGYALEEVAAIEGVPLGTVKSRISRAKSALRTILEER